MEFCWIAALIASHSDAESDDDLCPSLLARIAANNELRNNDDDGNSIPKLMGRKCHKSDLDDEVDKDGNSIPGLIMTLILTLMMSPQTKIGGPKMTIPCQIWNFDPTAMILTLMLSLKLGG
jgi:hypothetical protein